MSDAVTSLPGRGQPFLAGPDRTPASTDAAHLEGTQKWFDDAAPGQSSGAKTRRSGRQVLCILVRNVSGITLDPKRVVKYKAGQKFKQVDGYCNVAAEEVAGVTDEHYGAGGIPNNELFWIAVKGPSLLKTSLAGNGENVVGANSVLVSLAAATSQATTAGRVIAWGLTATSTGTTDGTYTNHLLHNFGRALSAMTTGQTNSDMLVDLFCLK